MVGAVVGGFLVGFAEIVIGTYTAGISELVGVGFGTIVPYLLMLYSAVPTVRPLRHREIGEYEQRSRK